MMDRRVRENLLYVGEAAGLRLRPYVLIFLALSLFGAGSGWVFQQLNAYLTPSYVLSAKADAGEGPTDEQAHIAIAKIGVEAPINFVGSQNPNEFLEPLKNGVAHYPSVLPGQQGASVMLGHSAPFGWPGNKYDAIFSNLKDLEQGDRVLITHQGKLHTYEVSRKTFLSRGQDIPEELKKSDRPLLLLLSCWPPGINNKRIMIEAEIL